MDQLGLLSGALFIVAGGVTAIVAMCGCRNRDVCGVGALIFTLWGVYTVGLSVDVIPYTREVTSVGQYAIAGWLVFYMGYVYVRTR